MPSTLLLGYLRRSPFRSRKTPFMQYFFCDVSFPNHELWPKIAEIEILGEGKGQQISCCGALRTSDVRSRHESTQRASDVHDDLQGILGTCRDFRPLFDGRGVALVLPWTGGTEFHGEEPNQQWFGDTFVPRVLLDGHDGDRQEYGQRGIRGLHATLQVSLLLLLAVDSRF